MVVLTVLLFALSSALRNSAFISRRAKGLEKLVTVCAWTKTIHYEERWPTFEEYLRQRFGISVTHGISRAAYDKLQMDVNPHTAKAAA